MTTRLDTHGESSCQKKRSDLNLFAVPRSVHSQRNLQLSHPPSIWPRHTETHNLHLVWIRWILGLDKPGSASSATWVWISLVHRLPRNDLKWGYLYKFAPVLISVSGLKLKRIGSSVVEGVFPIDYHSFRQKYGNEEWVKKHHYHNKVSRQRKRDRLTESLSGPDFQTTPELAGLGKVFNKSQKWRGFISWRQAYNVKVPAVGEAIRLHCFHDLDGLMEMVKPLYSSAGGSESAVMMGGSKFSSSKDTSSWILTWKSNCLGHFQVVVSGNIVPSSSWMDEVEPFLGSFWIW